MNKNKKSLFAGAILTAGLVGGGALFSAPAMASVSVEDVSVGDTIVTTEEITALNMNDEYVTISSGEEFSVINLQESGGSVPGVWLEIDGVEVNIGNSGWEIASASGGSGDSNGSSDDSSNGSTDDDSSENGSSNGSGSEGESSTDGGSNLIERGNGADDLDEGGAPGEEDDSDGAGFEDGAEGDFADASLSLDVDAVAPGGSVLATGDGFEPLENVNFDLNGVSLGSAEADQSGNVESLVEIPEDFEEGSYSFAAEGGNSGIYVEANLTVISEGSNGELPDEDEGEAVEIETGVIPGGMDSPAGLAGLVLGGALLAGAGGYAFHRSRQKDGEAVTNTNN